MHLGEVRQAYDDIRRLGAEALLVVQARPQFLTLFLRDQPLPFPALADPDRAAYRAFGLERMPWSDLLRVRILAKFFKLIFRGQGWRFRRRVEGEDVRQLGGDFVFDAGGRLTYVHRSADATDRPAVAELLRALGQVGERPSVPS